MIISGTIAQITSKGDHNEKEGDEEGPKGQDQRQSREGGVEPLRVGLEQVAIY